MLVSITKDNNSIPLENWDNYLKMLYDSPDTMGTILNTPIKEDIFSLEDIETRINKLTNGKANILKDTKLRSLKWEYLSSFLISTSFSILF